MAEQVGGEVNMLISWEPGIRLVRQRLECLVHVLASKAFA